MAWKTKIIPNDGWNAGARTIAHLAADGIAQFEVGQAGGIICGLNDVDTDAGYRELDHAIWIENNRVRVVEGGIEKTEWTTFTTGATFGIKRIRGVVRYYAGSTLLYTSIIESVGTVFLDCSLYLAGDTILDARITDYISTTDILSLSPLSGFGTDLNDNYGLIVLSNLVVENTDIPDPIALSPLSASGSDGNYGAIDLSPLSLINHELVPDINYGLLELSALQLLFVDMSETNDIIFTIPAPELSITGTVLSSGIAFTIPSPELSIYGGGVVEFELPAPTLTITGTTQNLARVEFEIPEPELIIAAYVGDVGHVLLAIPSPELSVFSGGRVAVEIPAPAVTIVGRTNSLARVAFTIPAPDVAVIGEVYGLARVAFEIPAPILYVGRGNQVIFEIPAPLLTIVASHANTSDETTYAINLNTGAVTQLLLGGFDKLVTAHGRLYGLKDGALTRLEGDVDGTATAIPVTIRFAQQTFNTNAVKRCSDVYWSTRESDGMTMDLIADEKTVWRYQTATDTAPAYGTHKIKTGRGITFHTAGLTVRNRSGGPLSIGGVELLVNPLSRKPK